MTQIQRRIFAVLTRLGGEEVARLLTDYRGAQLLDEGFGEFLVDEGVVDRDSIFDDSEEDEE
jgi:hypothetical protein